MLQHCVSFAFGVHLDLFWQFVSFLFNIQMSCCLLWFVPSTVKNESNLKCLTSVPVSPREVGVSPLVAFMTKPGNLFWHGCYLLINLIGMIAWRVTIWPISAQWGEEQCVCGTSIPLSFMLSLKYLPSYCEQCYWDTWLPPVFHHCSFLSPCSTWPDWFNCGLWPVGLVTPVTLTENEYIMIKPW